MTTEVRIRALNTSNAEKIQELRKFLGPLDVTCLDLREPDADPLTVAAVKALQAGPGVLVDDASLDVEGADIGVHVKWRMQTLPSLIGRPALYRVTIAVQTLQGPVHIFQGEVPGHICKAGVPGFGFDHMFQPIGASVPLSAHKPDHYNPRSIACRNLLNNQPVKTLSPFQWNGPWQT